jgi:arylsulfatase
MPDTVEGMVEKIDTIGGPNNYNNYPCGWAQVGNTPLRYYKQNTYEGGIRDPLIVHWPKGIKDPGGLRDQYHHVIDLLPTLLDIIGIEAPEQYQGIPQLPVEGKSLRYSFSSKNAPSVRKAQYYEMLGHRGIWSEGWKAVTYHEKGADYENEKWALYHTDKDFSECHDLSEEEPEKLKKLVQLFWTEAGRYNVLPLDDRLVELFTIRRPDSVIPGNKQRFFPGMPHLDRFKAPDTRNRSFEIKVSADLSKGDEGVIVASGARTGGITFFIQDEKLIFEYNYLGKPYRVESAEALPEGNCEIGLRYRKTADHKGTATMLVNIDGKESVIGKAPIETMPYRQTLFGMDVGKDTGPTVSASYNGPFPFTGKLDWVEFKLEDDRDDLKAAAEVEMQNMMAEQ